MSACYETMHCHLYLFEQSMSHTSYRRIHEWSDTRVYLNMRIHLLQLRGDWNEAMLLPRLDEVDSESSQTLLGSDMERMKHDYQIIGT